MITKCVIFFHCICIFYVIQISILFMCKSCLHWWFFCKIVFQCERWQLGFMQPQCFVQICNIYTSMKQNQGQPLTSLDFKGEIWLFLPKYNMTPKRSPKNLIAMETFCLSYGRNTPTCPQTTFSMNFNSTTYLFEPFYHHHLFPFHPNHSPNLFPPSQNFLPFFLSFAKTFHPTLGYNRRT